jgi:hypothetical protein
MTTTTTTTAIAIGVDGTGMCSVTNTIIMPLVGRREVVVEGGCDCHGTRRCWIYEQLKRVVAVEF